MGQSQKEKQKALKFKGISESEWTIAAGRFARRSGGSGVRRTKKGSESCRG
jgi:hypothetical protein